jgi:hypothetical protein
MKALRFLGLSTVLIMSMLLLTNCSGYIVATGPPLAQTEIILQPPSVYHVWVPGYYTYRGGTYVWIKGHYQVPPRNKTYVPGHWQKTNRGYKNHKGHWKKG